MELLQFCAMGLVYVGVFLIARLNVTGQYLMAAAQVLWGYVGFSQGMTGLILQSFGLFFLAIYAIWNWRCAQKTKPVTIEKGTRVLL